MKRTLLSLIALLLATNTAFGDAAPLCPESDNQVRDVIKNYRNPKSSTTLLVTAYKELKDWALEGNKLAQNFMKQENLYNDPALIGKNTLLKTLYKRCDSKDADACYSLAELYADGDFGNKDPQKALTYYQKAAALGDKFAYGEIGLMYVNGEGVEKNEAQAMEWFKKGAAAGDSISTFRLRELQEKKAPAEQPKEGN